MNKLRQMTITDKVMKMLNPISPHIIVAGGAPRDWYFDVQCNDVDIFFYRPDLETTYDTISTFKSIGLDILPLYPRGVDINSLVGHETYFINPNIAHVYETEISSLKFQFVQMKEKTFRSVVPHFPLNMSRIWYKNGIINPTQDFIMGERRKVLVKMGELYADGNKYIQKIRARFPDYTYFPSLQSFYEYLYRNEA